MLYVQLCFVIFQFLISIATFLCHLKMILNVSWIFNFVLQIIKYRLRTCPAYYDVIDLANGWIRTIWLDLVGQWNSRFCRPYYYFNHFFNIIFKTDWFRILKKYIHIENDSIPVYGSRNLEFHWLNKSYQMFVTQSLAKSMSF